MVRSRWVLLLLACAAAGCGKKGPPLPPLIHIPQAVGRIEARRLGSDVYVTLTVPSQNVDASTPADVNRIDLFAVTAAAPPPPNAFLRAATRIATVRVAAPSPSGGAEPRPAPPADDAAQGATVTIRETLTAEQLVASPSAAAAAADASKAAASAASKAAPPGAAPAAQPEAEPRRFYMAYAFSDRERSSTAGAMAAVPVGPVPAPPSPLTITYTQEAILVSWGASAGAVGYNIYRDGGTAPGEAAGVIRTPPPSPANPKPTTELTFSETPQFGQERCYEVRAIREVDSVRVEGDPGRRCVTPVDTFRPAAPTELSAVSRDDGGIELRWNANVEPDLAGYVVLRGTAGDATLLQITDTPITQTRYTDRAVMPGVRYVYAVVAVDGAAPTPNRSPESERDEVTAR